MCLRERHQQTKTGCGVEREALGRLIKVKERGLKQTNLEQSAPNKETENKFCFNGGGAWEEARAAN